MRRVLVTLLRLALGIGLIVYLIRSKIVDVHALSRMVSIWPISVAALTLLLIDLLLMSWRLCCLFRAQGLRLAWSDSWQLTSVSSFFSTFLPGRAGGDVAKIFYASKENSGRRTEIIAILLFDRAVGLFSLLLLPLLLAPIFPALFLSTGFRIAYAIVALLAALMIGGFLVCVLATPFIARLTAGEPPAGGMAKRPVRFLPGRQILARSLNTIAAYRRTPGPLLGALGISLADNLMGVCVLALALLVVNPGGIAPKLFVMVPIGQIVNSLPLTPGGLGVGEAAFHALFSVAGLKGGAEALLCWRIWNALVGMLGWIVYLRGFRARIPVEEAV
jgi:glycosyltransferase 2 family protein